MKMIYYSDGWLCLPLQDSLFFAETMNNFKLLPIAALCFLCGGAMLVADTFVTDESDIIYGKGVHAFFDRNYEEAITILSEAEKLNSADPRPYYFLGLACLRQQKTERADHYFEKAAELEYGGRAARDYAVAESLRRIQGDERLQIEKIRAEERINAQKREQRLTEIRYGKENATGREFLRQPAAQHRKEDLAVLQKIAESFGENAFGAKPIDPINPSGEVITTKKTEHNPFGEIVANIDKMPATIEMRPAARNVPARRQENVGGQTTPTLSPVAGTQATVAKELGKGLRTLFDKTTNEVAPTVTTWEPANGATDVNAGTVTELRVTFDVDMNTKSYSWCGSGETYPRTTGDAKWIDERTCALPVELESGREYRLGINAPSFKGFQSKEGVPVQPLLYKFSTQ